MEAFVMRRLFFNIKINLCRIHKRFREGCRTDFFAETAHLNVLLRSMYAFYSAIILISQYYQPPLLFD
ncbi:hypothetical protein EBS43_06945 [bacterium]|nr:hypothetical protein [bacterium]